MLVSIITVIVTASLVGLTYLYMDYLARIKFYRDQNIEVLHQFIHPIITSFFPVSICKFFGLVYDVQATQWACLHSKNGIMAGVFGTFSGISVQGPRFSKLVTSSPVDKSMPFTDALNKIFGEGLISCCDAVWKRQRPLIAPAFSPSLITEGVLSETKDVMNEWMKIVDGSGSKQVDLESAMGSIAIHVVGKVGFGYDFNSLENTKKNILCEGSEYFFRDSIWTVLVPEFIRKNVNIGALKKLNDYVSTFEGTVKGIIEARAKEPEVKRKDMLSVLLQASSNDDESKLTMQELVANCFFLLVAGHESTARSMFYTLYYLAKNPQYQKQIREDLESLLVTQTKSSREVRELNEDDIKAPQLQNLKNAMDEAFRLVPVFAETVRMAMKDFTYGEYKIKKGHYINYTWESTQRDKSFWGEDAEEFKPDRWSSEMRERLRRNPFYYSPFSIGKRACIGRLFAELEMLVVLSKMLVNYNITLTNKDEKLETVYMFSIVPARPILFNFERIVAPAV